MSYWPWWLGGLALAGIALLHWFAVGRLMGVSSRVSALVDHCRVPRPSVEDRARGAAPEGGASAEPSSSHLAFFAGLIGGGLVASLAAGSFALTMSPGATFARLFGGSELVTALVLTGGGVLVGIGTRMARGCTSGHGLCGVARLERGSLLATTAFFGTGVIVSMALGAVLR